MFKNTKKKKVCLFCVCPPVSQILMVGPPTVSVLRNPRFSCQTGFFSRLTVDTPTLSKVIQ